MKVLNVIGLLNPELGGGTAERTVQMSYFQNQAGISCNILTINKGVDEPLRHYLSGIDIVALPYISDRFHIPFPLLLTISRLVKEADIVHLMNHWSVLNVYVYLCSKIWKTPYVVCPAGTLQKFGRSIFLKSIYDWVIGRRIVVSAESVVAITKDEMSQFIAFGIPVEKMCVIPNGVVTETKAPNIDYGFRQKYGLGKRPYILFMGRLNSIKGPDLLIDAFCRWYANGNAKYDLVLAGPDDGLLKELKDKVRNADLHKTIHFVGYLTGEEKRQAFVSADLLVIPSRSEAMSLVVLEAGVLGTPVLATDTCGLNDLRQHRCGWICAPTRQGLYDGLTEALSSENRVLSGENLKSYVRENFDWARMITKYNNLYKTIV